MDEIDKKLFDDLSEQVEIPIKCEYVIRNALKSNDRKIKTSAKTVMSIIAKTVFATTKVIESVWNKPEKIDSFYGSNGEHIESEEYGIWHSKDINVDNYENIISENDAKEQINQILKKCGYENEKIQSIELIDNPSDTSLFYRATTENKFLIDLDAKDSKNFKIFTNVVYKNINNYRGTEEKAIKTVSELCTKYGYDTSQYSHISTEYNSEDSKDANIWTVKYNKEYDGIVNIYEEITIGIVPEINELYYLFYKNEETKYVELAVCNELMGEYNVIGSDDWAGWGKTLEGPCLVQRRNGSYVIYLDNYEEHQIYYSESDDLKIWSEKQPISVRNIAHLCIGAM